MYDTGGQSPAKSWTMAHAIQSPWKGEYEEKPWQRCHAKSSKSLMKPWHRYAKKGREQKEDIVHCFVGDTTECGGTWEIVKGTGTGTLSSQLRFCWSGADLIDYVCTLTQQSSGTYHRLFGWYCDLRLVRLWPDLALSVAILCAFASRLNCNSTETILVE